MSFKIAFYVIAKVSSTFHEGGVGGWSYMNLMDKKPLSLDGD